MVSKSKNSISPMLIYCYNIIIHLVHIKKLTFVPVFFETFPLIIYFEIENIQSAECTKKTNNLKSTLIFLKY